MTRIERLYRALRWGTAWGKAVALSEALTPQSARYDSGNGGNGYSVPVGGGQKVPIAHVSGDALLNLTDADDPVAVDAGTYAVTVTASPDSARADSDSFLKLRVGDVEAYEPLPVGDQSASLTVVRSVDAGDLVAIQFQNGEAAPLVYYFDLWIEKLA